jgi:hypothetical protein
MKWIKPDSPDFDQARKVFNAMIDRRPAVIAQCSNDAEVAEALHYGRDHSLAVAVRAGGHSVAGMSTNDGGLVVDVRPMKTIDVDPESGIVTAGPSVSSGPPLTWWATLRTPNSTVPWTTHPTTTTTGARTITTNCPTTPWTCLWTRPGTSPMPHPSC